jgi:flagellar motor switch protein FliN
MTTYLDSWIGAASALLTQALAGEAEFAESLPKPFEAGSFGFTVSITGDEEGRFSIVLDAGILNAPLLGEGVDQKAAWNELLREVAESACGDVLAKTGRKLSIEKIEEISSESKISRAFQLKTGSGAWAVLVRDEVRAPKKAAEAAKAKSAAQSPAQPAAKATDTAVTSVPGRPGIDLLLDVELEATLRFGSREIPLGDLLELGPGDVVQLDRHVADPVDLIVADKIVARGDVVLVNGNFGLRVTEVAEPRMRLETIRCLF